MPRTYSRISGTGRYLPERVLTNFDLEKTLDTSDEWIRSRTGISAGMSPPAAKYSILRGMKSAASAASFAASRCAFKSSEVDDMNRRGGPARRF